MPRPKNGYEQRFGRDDLSEILPANRSRTSEVHKVRAPKPPSALTKSEVQSAREPLTDISGFSHLGQRQARRHAPRFCAAPQSCPSGDGRTTKVSEFDYGSSGVRRTEYTVNPGGHHSHGATDAGRRCSVSTDAEDMSYKSWRVPSYEARVSRGSPSRSNDSSCPASCESRSACNEGRYDRDEEYDTAVAKKKERKAERKARRAERAAKQNGLRTEKTSRGGTRIYAVPASSSRSRPSSCSLM
jgi:hypothetical protein